MYMYHVFHWLVKTKLHPPQPPQKKHVSVPILKRTYMYDQKPETFFWGGGGLKEKVLFCNYPNTTLFNYKLNTYKTS